MYINKHYCYICNREKMKNKILQLLLLVFTANATAQIHEIGVFLGGTNYIGDIGPTTYISPDKLGYGFLYKWNRSTRHSYRFSYYHGTITAKDADSDVPSRFLRGLAFENKINEFSLGLEFNFFPFDLHGLEPQTTPYLHTGISYFSYQQLFYVNGEVKDDFKDGAAAIPMVLGIKTRISKKFVLAAEIGARYTFSDNLDGSNPSNPNLVPLRFANQNSNDWYVFSGFTLTYTFGQNPCFCPH